jgi:hypothetical protein
MALTSRKERRLRRAAVLVLFALVVEEISLRWTHPTAFLLFAGVTGGVLAIGLSIYLRSLLTAQPRDSIRPPPF